MRYIILFIAVLFASCQRTSVTYPSTAYTRQDIDKFVHDKWVKEQHPDSIMSLKDLNLGPVTGPLQ